MPPLQRPRLTRIKGWPDDPELELLLRHADPPLSLAIILMCDAGCRLREALAFNVTSLSGHMLRIWATKTQTWRSVPLTRRLTLALSRADSLLGITPRHIQRRLHALAHRAGTPPTTPHRLRHSYASRLAAEGIPVHEISRLLGHKNLTVTLIYLHGDDDAYQKAAQALNRRTKQAQSRPERGRIQPGSGPQPGRSS